MSANFAAAIDFPIHNTDPSPSGSIVLDGQTVNFCIRQNKRLRRTRLLISPELGVIIESKKHISVSAAQQLVLCKQAWLVKNLEITNNRRERFVALKKLPNSTLVFGQEKIIVIKTGLPQQCVMETATQILLGFADHQITTTRLNKILSNWLKEKARNYLPTRLRHLNRQFFPVHKSCVRDQKSLWGSCNSKHHLNLSWRLVMAPVHASDYILVHELCHTQHLNHSKSFWALVQTLFPQYQKAEQWFKDYGFVLHSLPESAFLTVLGKQCGLKGVS
ncbi:MAG: hypothetical protein ACD_62C00169G0022 [uncultured bacterium]|nr:MAG: hypothetical protein ACD_62C00169G0022 [uncultured bacterium]